MLSDYNWKSINFPKIFVNFHCNSSKTVQSVAKAAIPQGFESADCSCPSGIAHYSTRTSRHRQKGISYVPKKILTWMLREARGVLKATVGKSTI